MNLLRRPQLGSAAPRLGGLSLGFKPSTCRCHCLGASGSQADSSWSVFEFRIIRVLCFPCPCESEKSLGSSSDIQRGELGLITLETPSAASAQEIPQLPGEGTGPPGGAVRCRPQGRTGSSAVTLYYYYWFIKQWSDKIETNIAPCDYFSRGQKNVCDRNNF